MNWDEALDLVVARTRHERFRTLCADDNPDAAQRDAYRRVVVRMASQGAPQADYPPAYVQAGSVIVAAASFVASGFATVSDDEKVRRLAICRDCEHFDAAAARCRKCGCYAAIKSRLPSQSCPIGRW